MSDAETMAPVYLRNWVEAEEEVTELKAEIKRLRTNRDDWMNYCQQAQEHRDGANAQLALTEAEIERLRAQLPEGMKDCTIVFKKCYKGHGELTATNWVQHPWDHAGLSAIRTNDTNHGGYEWQFRGKEEER
jgi:hypothetical protein